MIHPLVRKLAAEKIPVAVTCRVLGFSTQAYYKWLAQPVTRVPQFVGSRGLQIRVLSCGDAYWRVFRACHYTLRWPE
jgi:hypothetical protein